MQLTPSSLWSFVKKNWLVLVLGFFTLQYLTGSIINRSPGYTGLNLESVGTKSFPAPASDSFAPLNQIAPSTASSRLVIRDTNLSLQVTNVSESLTQIQNIAQVSGGFLVNYNLSSPESASSGNISIRVPAATRSQVLTKIQALGVKTVSLSVNGQDVTDQFVDNTARLKVLYATQAKFEQILDQAVRIQDLLDVQRELINLQTQIDAIKGQQQYLEKSAELSLISVYLSTDELALPYAPTDTWRPLVIFREATRSLIGLVRVMLSAAIWLAVYSPLIFAVGLIGWWLKRRSPKV